MNRWDVTFLVCCLLLVAVLIWHNSQPYITPALAAEEEPCIRTTTGIYTRNYPPVGTTLNRRPSNWGVCTPFSPYEEP